MVAVALATGALAPGGHQTVAAATAPPAPPSPSNVAPTTPPVGPLAPTPSSKVSVPLTKPKPDASPSPPTEDNRKGLDGVWEVAIQSQDGDTKYVHFKIAQKATVVTGIYLDNLHNDKKYPAAGSYEGQSFHLVVTKDDGTTITFESRVEGTSDMVGMMKEGSNQVAFTAAYRPKYKFLDTISPAIPGGISGGTGGPP